MNTQSYYSSTPPSSSRFSLTSSSTSSSTTSLPSKRDSRTPSQPHPPSLQQQLFGASPQPTAGILDRPLNRTKGAEVGLNAFAFLLAEVVSYSQSRVDSVTDLERRYAPCSTINCFGSGELKSGDRLSSLGYEAGVRILSLILLRNTQLVGGKVPSSRLRHGSLAKLEKEPKREHRLIPILQFVHTQVYRYCFGRPADGLERSVEVEDECEFSFFHHS